MKCSNNMQNSFYDLYLTMDNDSDRGLSWVIFHSKLSPRRVSFSKISVDGIDLKIVYVD